MSLWRISVELNIISSFEKQKEKICVDNFKTDYSLNNLSGAFNIFFEIICNKNYNKKKLAKLIADNFETSRSKNPSEHQVYKNFYSNNDGNNEKLRSLAIEIMNRVNKNK